MTVVFAAPIRVIVVDDHPLVRLGLRTFFDLIDDVDLIGEAGSVIDAEHLIKGLVDIGEPPHVVLMDILLPDGDGVAATATIHACFPEIAVVALTSCDDARQIRSALQAGAAGYVLKDSGPDEVLAVVRSAACGRGSLEPALALKAAEPQAAGISALTSREREVVALVAEGDSNRQIAAKLVITERTARTHVSNALRKLGLASRTQAALWAMKEGLAPHH